LLSSTGFWIAAGLRPITMSFAATGSSAMPMIRMTLPVTTGGKNFTSFENEPATRKVKMPATMTEP
jgi:hypothetical protein